jgi:type IV secretion system pilin
MKNFKIKLLLIVTVLMSSFSMSLSAAALDCANPTTPKDQIQCGACNAAGSTTCDPTTSSKSLSDTIAKVINILSVVAGALAVVMIIIGGFRYTTSAGSAEATKSARNTIVYAVIGLIIIALAQIIVHFVLNNVTNTSSAGSGGSTGTQSSGSGRTGAGAGERPN